MPAPDSRETLFALLAEMKRPEDTTPTGLAAAREAMQAGHLGPPNEAFVEDTAGSAIPILAWASSRDDVDMVQLLLDLGASVDVAGGNVGSALHAAVARGQLATVRLLLDRGATPLGVRESRESVLRTAHRHVGEPGGREIFNLVRRAARAASEGMQAPCNGLATPPFDHRYTLRPDRGVVDRGVHDLRCAVEAEKQLDLLLVECELRLAARALDKLVKSPRREADVGNRPVADAERLVFVYRLDGIPWTIIPLVFEVGSMWNVARVTELAAAGAGIDALARALASATESRVLHIRFDEYTVYSAQGGIDTRTFGDGTTDMTEELGRLDVLVPPMSVQTDGYNVQLELFGVDASQVERVDVVVFQEHGDSDVDRSIVQRAAPALVGAAPPAAKGQPPMVGTPPAIVAPRQSAPPPMVNEPPAIVTEPAAAKEDLPTNDTPPMVNEPPLSVAEPAQKNEPPPMVDEPPPVVAEPAPAKNEPPPAVNEPPPIVSEPAVPNDEPPMVRESSGGGDAKADE